MLRLQSDRQSYEVSKADDGSALLNGQPAKLDIHKGAGALLSVLHNGRSYTAFVQGIDRQEKRVTLNVNGQDFSFAISEPIDQLLEKLGMNSLASKKADAVKAPMPGMVLKVMVAPGQAVQKGDALLVLEAMKMENVIKAAAPGVVKAVAVGERTTVEKGSVMIEME